MKNKIKRAWSVVEYVVLISAIVTAFLIMAIFLKRAVPGRWEQSADVSGFGKQNVSNNTTITTSSLPRTLIPIFGPSISFNLGLFGSNIIVGHTYDPATNTSSQITDPATGDIYLWSDTVLYVQKHGSTDKVLLIKIENGVATYTPDYSYLANSILLKNLFVVK